MTVVRPGTAVRPRPGSSATRIPVLGTTGLPALRSHSDTREGRLVSWTAPWATRAYHHADVAERSSTATATPSAPRSRTVASADTPESGSAVRAGPIGNNGDAAIATTTATAAAASPTTTARSSETPINCDRPNPSERSTGWSTESTYDCRAIACPTTSSAVSAMTT